MADPKTMLDAAGCAERTVNAIMAMTGKDTQADAYMKLACEISGKTEAELECEIDGFPTLESIWIRADFPQKLACAARGGYDGSTGSVVENACVIFKAGHLRAADQLRCLYLNMHEEWQSYVNQQIT